MLLYPEKTDVIELDLKMFDVDESDRKKQAQKSRERAEVQKDPNFSSSKKGNWFFLIILAAGVLLFFFIYSHGKIEMDRVNGESIVVAGRLDEAKWENARLKTELEALATPSRVEQYAAENGLIREQISQVAHISVNVEKVVEVSERYDNDVLRNVRGWFADKLEFLGW